MVLIAMWYSDTQVIVAIDVDMYRFPRGCLSTQQKQIVTGGITYAHKESPSPLEIDDKDKWYIGFDCAHAFDTTDFLTVNRVSDELRHIVGQILSEESEVQK